MGARERWAWLTMATICASRVSEPIRSARMTKEPVPLTVPPVTLAEAFFFNGDGFAADHGLVNGAVAFEDDAVDGNLLARSNAQAISYLYLGERNIALAVCVQTARGLRCEIEQRAQGASSRAAGAQLQHLPEQDQRDDDHGRLEVKRGRLTPPRERTRETAPARQLRGRCTHKPRRSPAR